MSFREVDIDGKNVVGIGVDLTDICNRKCITCFANITSRCMHWDIFKKIVEEGVYNGFSEFYILGGEPTLHPDIIKMLEYAKKRFELVILVTNMDKLSEFSFCKKVFETGVTIAGQRQTIGRDTTSQKMIQILTGGDNLITSNQAWDNVEKIFPPDRVCVQCCITRPVVQNGNIYDLFRWIRKKGFEPIMEFTKEGGLFKRGCQWDVDSAEMLEIFKNFQEIDKNEFGIVVDTLTPQAYGKTCHLLESSVHFLVDGTAIPCVGYQNLCYGNILHNDMKEIINSQLRQIISNPAEWIYGYCKNECIYFKECTGGCRGSAFDISGCPRASFYYCPHIPRDKLSLSDMIPETCEGCYLEGNPVCNPKRGDL